MDYLFDGVSLCGGSQGGESRKSKEGKTLQKRMTRKVQVRWDLVGETKRTTYVDVVDTQTIHHPCHGVERVLPPFQDLPTIVGPGDRGICSYP